MKTVKHTPGPWSYAESKGGSWLVYGPDDKPIKPRVKTPKRSTRLQRANAQLLAAAPKLKEFVKTVAHMKTESEFGNDQPESEDWICTLNDLIESARETLKAVKL